MGMRLRGWLIVVALVVGAACLGYLSTRAVWTADWSSGQRASLSPTSRAVLAKLHGPVTITGYTRPGDKLRTQIAEFIARYQRFKPDITLHFIDPAADPAAARAAGITINGELVVHYGDQQRHLRHVGERSLTNALESLARGGTQIVAFVTGNGERWASGKQSGDLGTFVHQLEQRGIRAVPLNFAQVSAVPQGARLVVLASPRTALSGGAVKALVSWVADGGNLLWLAEPHAGELGLAPLAAALGIQKLPGVLARGQSSAPGAPVANPLLVTVGRYPPQTITDGFTLNTLFPAATALARAALGQWHVAPILRSGTQSWTETTRAPTDHVSPWVVGYDANSGDVKGPLDFGFALTRLSPSPSHNEQRVVVIGDGDFLSNAFVGKAGNRAFGERVFNWLLGDDALIGIPPRKATVAPLSLTQHGLNVFAGIFLVALPLLLIILGIALTWRRRRR